MSENNIKEYDKMMTRYKRKLETREAAEKKLADIDSMLLVSKRFL